MFLILFFVATFVQIFVMVLQSRNVNSGQYLSAAIGSLFIGLSQFIVIKMIQLMDPIYGLMITCIAGPLAVVFAMWFHRKFFK